MNENKAIDVGIHPIHQQLSLNIEPDGTLKMISILKTLHIKLTDNRKDNTHADTHS